jgi:hypothetical protein
MWDESERTILERLDEALRGPTVRAGLDALARRAAARLAAAPDEPHAWEPVPLGIYGDALPEGIRSSWVFVLRRGTETGAERHPNSHQRMASYRGRGDFQIWEGGTWRSHPLDSDPGAALERRWVSIPVGVYHQGVVPKTDWVVVSFHTAGVNELIEERGDPAAAVADRRRLYQPGGGGA